MTDLRVRLTPEDEHLANQERLLRVLTEELATDEAAFATMTATFSRFRITYLTRFAPLYAELDRLLADAARLAADRLESAAPDTTDGKTRLRKAKVQAEAAEARAASSASAANEAGATSEPLAASSGPSAELKALYREVAKAVHPDLATDEEQKARRTHLMSAASAAYAAGDEATLRRILEDEAVRPESIIGSDVGSRLVRVLRQVAQVRSRLATLEQLRRELEIDPMWELFQSVYPRMTLGENPLEETERKLRTQIRSARARLAALRLRDTPGS